MKQLKDRLVTELRLHSIVMQEFAAIVIHNVKYVNNGEKKLMARVWYDMQCKLICIVM